VPIVVKPKPKVSGPAKAPAKAPGTPLEIPVIGKIGIEVHEGDVAGTTIPAGQYTFAELLEMEDPPLPRPVLEAIRDEMQPNPLVIGVTRLTGCLRKTFFQYTQPWFISLSTAMTLLDGRIAHSNLENTRFQFYGWFEFPIAKEYHVRGREVVVVGKVDYYDLTTKTLWDWKRTSEYGIAIKAKKGPWIGHVLQVQAYYTILRDILHIDHLKLLTFTRSKDPEIKNPLLVIHEVERKDITDWIEQQLELLFKALDANDVDILPFPPAEHAWLCKNKKGECAFHRMGLCPGVNGR